MKTKTDVNKLIFFPEKLQYGWLNSLHSCWLMTSHFFQFLFFTTCIILPQFVDNFHRNLLTPVHKTFFVLFFACVFVWEIHSLSKNMNGRCCQQNYTTTFFHFKPKFCSQNPHCEIVSTSEQESLIIERIQHEWHKNSSHKDVKY